MARKSGPPDPPIIDTSVLLARWGAQIDPDMLRLALTHRSWAYEAGGEPHNERLEFLGDSVLSIIISERLFWDYPDLPESDLSRMRAATVSQSPLAIIAKQLDLGQFIWLGKGESMSGGRQKDSILSDTVEALIAATYLTNGLEVTRRVVLNLTAPLLEHALERGQAQDWKTTLAEYAQEYALDEPIYTVEGFGPDHCRRFEAHVSFGEGAVVGTGAGSSKKHAEDAAAHQALEDLDPGFAGRVHGNANR